MQNTRELILSEIREKHFALIKDRLASTNVVDMAELLEEIDRTDALVTFRMLPKDKAVKVFAYLTPEMQQHVILASSDKELAEIVHDLYFDDTVSMLEEMPATVVERILKDADPTTRKTINQLLNYPEDSAGSIMTTEFIGLKKEMTVGDAFAYIRKNGVDRETVYICYVTDATRLLEGVVSVRTLLLADTGATIESLMDTQVKYVFTTEDKESAASMLDKYDLLALPVVDGERRLVGILTVDDVWDVLKEEATEDFEKMAAMTPSEQPYLKTSVFTHFKHRIIWLLLLMVSASLTGGIITRFEDALAAVPLLTAAIPMLMDSGGNAGSQTATLIIRGMALDEVRYTDLFRVIWKEIRIAVLCGGVLAVVNFGRLMLMYNNFTLSLVTSLSLWVTVCMAKLVGCILPIGAKRLGLDPAIMASPLITTIVDACSLVVYFNIAKLILHIG